MLKEIRLGVSLLVKNEVATAKRKDMTKKGLNRSLSENFLFQGGNHPSVLHIT
jgi:hypothetical protein